MANQNEWVGTIAELAATVDADGEPYRASLLTFAPLYEGPQLFFEVGPTATLLAAASTHLRTALGDTTDVHLRIASAPLAAALRPSLPPGVELVEGDAPELATLLADLQDRLNAEASSYLPSDLPPSTIASLFRTAAALFAAKPWDEQTIATAPMRVRCEALDLEETYVVVTGVADDSRGFLVFDDREALEEYAVAQEAMEKGTEASFPPHLAFMFEEADELPEAITEGIAKHGWVVAAPDAHPVLTAVSDNVALPVSAEQVEILEAIAGAVTALALDVEPLHPYRAKVPLATRTVDMELFLVDAEDMFGDEGVEESDVVLEFGESPEAAGLADLKWALLLDECASRVFDVPVEEVTPEDLTEFVFDIIPVSVRVDPMFTRNILEELRAFYRYLARKELIADPAPYQAVLGEEAETKLHAILRERSNKGAAKLVLGTDRASAAPKDTKTAKNKRKAQRKARKKNR